MQFPGNDPVPKWHCPKLPREPIDTAESSRPTPDLNRLMPFRSSCRLAALVLIFVLGAGPVAAQQVLVDDPTSVAPGAAQLEAWHSSQASWMAPALRVHSLLEVAAGAAFVDVGTENRRTVEYSAEGKLLLRPGSAHRIGGAVVGGTGLSEMGATRDALTSAYGYGILSQDLIPGQLVAYQNLGWLKVENGPHQLTWGARIDWTVVDWLTVIGEAYGEGRADPSFQAALRTVLLPDRIEMDVSVTRAGSFANRNTWATVGFTFMSAPLY